MGVEKSERNGSERNGNGSNGTCPFRGAAVGPDLERIEDGRQLLSTLGTPVDFWEALCFAQQQNPAERPPAPEGSIEDSLNPVVKGAIDLGLRRLRQELGPLARDLRFLLERSAVGFDAGHAEKVIGFILASERDREAALKWVNDPVGCRGEMVDRLAQVSKHVELFERGVRSPAAFVAGPERAPAAGPIPPKGNGATPGPRHSAMPPLAPKVEPSVATVAFRELPPAPPPVKLEAKVVSAPALQAAAEDMVESERVKDVRRARAWVEQFRTGPSRVDLWETIFLLLTQGATIRPAIDDLLRTRTSGDAAAFREGSFRLFKQFLNVRSEWGWFVGRLRIYLEPMFRGKPAEDVFEIALGLLIALRSGRERAVKWLDQPDRFKAEAEAQMKSLLEAAERCSSKASSAA